MSSTPEVTITSLFHKVLQIRKGYDNKYMNKKFK